jgi:hypothetical protein
MTIILTIAAADDALCNSNNAHWFSMKRSKRNISGFKNEILGFVVPVGSGGDIVGVALESVYTV